MALILYTLLCTYLMYNRNKGLSIITLYWITITKNLEFKRGFNMQKFSRNELSEDYAYQTIISMIIDHNYPPGASVRELQIAETLKISRTPVRCALKRLVSEGLLDSTPNKGCSIPLLSRKDLDCLFRYRYVVEPACAREAAQCYTPQYESQINELINEEDECVTKNPWQLHFVNEKIHNLIVEMSNNPYYANAVKQVNWRTQLYLFFFDDFYSERVRQISIRPKEEYKSPFQHIQLFDAIMNKDADSAEQIMYTHISSTYNFLTKREW